MKRQDFDPGDIRKEDMKKLASVIEDYINELEAVMIIPDEIIDDYGDQIHEGIKRARKLINKLNKGDKDVFKDIDEWNYVN